MDFCRNLSTFDRVNEAFRALERKMARIKLLYNAAVFKGVFAIAKLATFSLSPAVKRDDACQEKWRDSEKSHRAAAQRTPHWSCAHSTLIKFSLQLNKNDGVVVRCEIIRPGAPLNCGLLLIHSSINLPRRREQIPLLYLTPGAQNLI